MSAVISTDICIVGAGPVGLFAVFEAGLLKLRCHVVDALPQPGGQLTEIYPKKPIYDIPGFPEVLAGDLVDNLMKQIEPFHPTFTLGERVERFAKLDDGSFQLYTTDGTEIQCKAVAIAGGLGSFEPRKPAVENLERFEGGKGVHYMVRDPEHFRDKKIVIAGGGDSALDWTNFLANVASDVTLVHRGTTFRGFRAAVYCDAFVVARYEYGVSSQAASGVPFSSAASSFRSSKRSVIAHRKKSESGRTPVTV